ncbi:MAG: AAA-like domain-containing protein [Anaerolineae bacterium]|nr:AAA-like domain-containing protein [Anaerolineae bacterium]
MLCPSQLPEHLATLTYADLTDLTRRDEIVSRIVQGLRTDVSKVAPSIDAQRTRIFISYKRNVEPDEQVALQIFQALSRQYDVFIDQAMLVGTHWAEYIEDQLRQADFCIVFLSAQSVHSEMVLGEVAMAHHMAKVQKGRPVTLPVRLAYREPFPYPLNMYLDPINWAFWQGPGDTPRLIKELVHAIFGGTLTIDERFKSRLVEAAQPPLVPEPLASAQPVRLEMPEGTMDPQSKFYVERQSDQIALEAIKYQGVTITIKAPRQMGKSSLLVRIIEAAAKASKRVAFLDFQLFDRATLDDANVFFRQFCAWLTTELNIKNRIDDYWDVSLGNSQRCTNYVSGYILEELKHPLVLTMDEVESVFGADFRSDFFGMLRSWHNKRLAGSIWKQLDLALVTSTEPYQLIENLNQSPFNVGEIIELTDFTLEQITDLNRRHGLPLTAGQEQQLVGLLGGHPYLTRRALYLVASQRISATDLFSHATDDRGPFGDHLRYHLFRLSNKEDLIQGMCQVMRNSTCSDEHIFFRLRGAGLVRREGRYVLPRCQLYADYFRERLT